MKRCANTDGFTLIELLIGASVLLFTLLGLTLTYIRCQELNELSQNTFIALTESRSKMEEIKNELAVAIEDSTVSITDVVNTYDDVPFNPSQTIDGMGVSYVDDSNPDLIEIVVSFCWQERGGRVVGEDADLDGVLDAGEDANGNGIIDSMVQMRNLVYTE